MFLMKTFLSILKHSDVKLLLLLFLSRKQKKINIPVPDARMLSY